jgi:hypothetical protein
VHFLALFVISHLVIIGFGVAFVNSVVRIKKFGLVGLMYMPLVNVAFMSNLLTWISQVRLKHMAFIFILFS